LQHLDKLGYNDGPPESAEFGVVDGEEIEIKVEHNLCLEGYINSFLKIKFYKHLPFDRYSTNLKIVNKGDQGEDEKSHIFGSYTFYDDVMWVCVLLATYYRNVCDAIQAF
jgi:hypothetical protein